MQIEAGMAAVTAVQEMLLQCVRGTIRVFPGVPARWREVSFARMRTEGAFLVSARRVGGRTAEVRIESEAGGPLRIQNNIAPQVALTHRGEKRLVSGDCIEVETRAGDVVLLRPAASPR
jgi:alpha-L-fucosidase 2